MAVIMVVGGRFEPGLDEEEQVWGEVVNHHPDFNTVFGEQAVVESAGQGEVGVICDGVM